MLAHATILRTVSRTSSKVIKTQKTEDNNYDIFRVLRWLHENCGNWGGELIVKV